MKRGADMQLAEVAGAIGHPARAAMLEALLGGEALPAGELARRAGIAAGTASAHLARLEAGGLIVVRPAGRQRLYALSGREVAAALEALARVARRSSPDLALQFARTCYDHLAGRLGVLVTDTLVAREYLTGPALQLSDAGASWLGSLDIDVAALRRQRRTLTRPCLDWTERRHHLAGAAGAALVDTLLERGWLVRLQGTRAVRLTVRGQDGLYRSLGMQLDLP